jgi:hypothetical protein
MDHVVRDIETQGLLHSSREGMCDKLEVYLIVLDISAVLINSLRELLYLRLQEDSL